MSRRLTGRQITTVVVALCLAVIAFPVGSVAAGVTKVRVADSTYASRVAHVTAQGRLITDTRDADSCGSVDAGKQRVGDGSGALTVDGSVLPYNPGTAFSRFIGSEQLIKPGLASGKIMVTSLSFINDSGTPAGVRISNTGDPSCTGGPAGYAYAGNVSGSSTLVVTFPSPLVLTRCAFVTNIASGVTVTGYLSP